MESAEITFTLNTNILKGIPFGKYQNDFDFIVSGKRYPVPRIVADLLSPIIRNLHYQDETIQEYRIDIESGNEGEASNNDDGNDDFLNFVELCNCESKQLSERQRELYSTYFFKLGNIDSYFKLHPEFISGISTENSIEILTKIESITNNFSNISHNSEYIESVERVFSFIASHFDDIDKEGLKIFPIETIEKIICNDDLKIREEDDLLDFVMSFYEKDRRFSILFEYVFFENVSEEKLKRFVKEFYVDDINGKVWQAFCRHLFVSESNSHKDKEDKRYTDRSIEFNMSEGKEFEGIMRHLTSETGGNIHDNGTIEITSNMIHESNHPKNLVDYESEDLYYPSGNDKGAFACFDFKDKLVQLSSYSIRSHNRNPNSKQLKNWAIEVSQDGQTWIEIDRRENEEKLNGAKVTATFKISFGSLKMAAAGIVARSMMAYFQ